MGYLSPIQSQDFVNLHSISRSNSGALRGSALASMGEVGFRRAGFG